MKLGGLLKLSLFWCFRFFFFLVHFCVFFHVQVSGGGSYQNQRLSFQSRKASSHSLPISTLNTLINALQRDLVFCLPSPFRSNNLRWSNQTKGTKWAGGRGRATTQQPRATGFISQPSFGHHRDLGISVCPWFHSLLAKSACKCIPLLPYLFRASFCHNVSSL